MWDIIAVLIGLAGATFGFFMKRAIDRMDTEIKKIPELDRRLDAQLERINSITRDHTHFTKTLDKMDINLEKMDLNLDGNNKLLAALKSSTESLEKFIQNLVSGNLIIRKQ